MSLIWTLTEAQAHLLPPHEAEDEEAGGGGAAEGGEVSYHVICNEEEVQRG